MDVDDTLVLILEWIHSPVTLIRAASTCRRWRRLIADAGFLRRCHSLRCRCRSLIECLCRGWDYNESWDVLDSRGSLLLIEHIHHKYISGVYPDLVVCEPQSKCYRIIPIPRNFDAADCMLRGPFLVDGDEDDVAGGGRISLFNFRVMYVLFSRDDHDVAHTTMFTYARHLGNGTWSEKAIDHIASKLHPSVKSCYLGRALGSSYFYVPQEGMLITRNGSTGKFSSSSVLSDAIKSCWDRHISTKNFCVVDGGDGEPRIVTMMDHTMELFARVDGQWGLENKVLLSKVTCGLHGYQPSFFDKPLAIVQRGVGFVAMSPQEPKQKWWLFSIDLKSMKVARTPTGRVTRKKMAYPCEFSWPPVLQVCLDT